MICSYVGAALIVDSLSVSCDHGLVGGKARNLWLLGQRVRESRVPDWFCVSTQAFTQFIQVTVLIHNYNS